MTPPRSSLPTQHPGPRSKQRREREEAALRTLYPDAVPWYGIESGRWLAAPSGATRLFQALTAATLSEMLADHYRRMIPHTPRPARVEQHRRPDGAFGAVAQRTASQPPGPFATAPSKTLAESTRPEAATRSAVPRQAVSRTPSPSTPARPGAVQRPVPAAPAAARPSGRRGIRHPASKNGWPRRGLIRLGLVVEAA